jgi:hypothetical protein
VQQFSPAATTPGAGHITSVPVTGAVPEAAVQLAGFGDNPKGELLEAFAKAGERRLPKDLFSTPNAAPFVSTLTIARPRGAIVLQGPGCSTKTAAEQAVSALALADPRVRAMLRLSSTALVGQVALLNNHAPLSSVIPGPLSSAQGIISCYQVRPTSLTASLSTFVQGSQHTLSVLYPLWRTLLRSPPILSVRHTLYTFQVRYTPVSTSPCNTSY